MPKEIPTLQKALLNVIKHQNNPRLGPECTDRVHFRTVIERRIRPRNDYQKIVSPALRHRPFYNCKFACINKSCVYNVFIYITQWKNDIEHYHFVGISSIRQEWDISWLISSNKPEEIATPRSPRFLICQKSYSSVYLALISCTR